MRSVHYYEDDVLEFIIINHSLNKWITSNFKKNSVRVENFVLMCILGSGSAHSCKGDDDWFVLVIWIELETSECSSW